MTTELWQEQSFIDEFGGHSPLVCAILKSFLADLATAEQHLREASESRNISDFKRHAHWILGPAAQLHLLALAECCRRMEAGDFTALSAFTELVQQSRTLLEQYLSENC
ncbi:Hpt domain-containing protein [Pseudidiomarina salilacus]|uniref:Hpt domain-containing protein n=1 Tax=Pseudidiomarina salilacus TaxID=3384452 RepID=UPI003984BEEB